MNLKDLARKATSLGLPSLGKALGGPLGEAAGTMLARTLGLPSTASTEDVLTAIASPEAMVALRQIEADLAKARLDADVTAYATEVDDRKDARANLHMSRIPAVITVSMIALVAALAAALIFLPVPEANQRILDTVLGSMLGGFTMSLSYWLGSSRGSMIKSLQKGD